MGRLRGNSVRKRAIDAEPAPAHDATSAKAAELFCVLSAANLNAAMRLNEPGSIEPGSISTDRKVVAPFSPVRIDRKHVPGHRVAAGLQRVAKPHVDDLLIGGIVDRL